MKVAPSTIKDATAFVKEHHRHSCAPQGGLFAVRVIDDDGQTRGVAIAGRPVARLLADGWTVEVTRVCTLGDPNACSQLYSAICRAAKALGYRKAITYTLQAESGVSLKASGFVVEAEVLPCDSWSRPSRGRQQIKRDTGPKYRWSRRLNDG